MWLFVAPKLETEAPHSSIKLFQAVTLRRLTWISIDGVQGFSCLVPGQGLVDNHFAKPIARYPIENLDPSYQIGIGSWWSLVLWMMMSRGCLQLPRGVASEIARLIRKAMPAHSCTVHSTVVASFFPLQKHFHRCFCCFDIPYAA